MPILETRGVGKRFGGLKAVNDVSLNVEEGQIYGLIGPNGAGKTTLLNCLCGAYRPEEGQVLFHGEDITGKKPHIITNKGMSRTYQIVRSFPQMTALENVLVGGIFGANLSRSDARKKALEFMELVEFPADPDTLAMNLNTMQLKKLEIARALTSDCKLLLLDEVAAGLTPAELVDITALMRKMRDEMGITIIIVEHLMKLILDVCDHIAVLCFGELIAVGEPEKVMSDPQVQTAYLGENYML
jgi:ABC-type branched-chain amino acid transport systems, ATPase component